MEKKKPGQVLTQLLNLHSPIYNTEDRLTCRISRAFLIEPQCYLTPFGQTAKPALAFPTGLGNQSLLVLPVSVLKVWAGKSPETQETKEDARNTMPQDGSTEGVFFRELTVLYWAGLCGPVPALVLPAGPLDLQPPLAPKGKKAASL